MKIIRLPISVLTASVFVLSGCAQRTVYVERPGPAVVEQPGQVEVAEAPPTPPAEVVVQAPGPGYVWVPGYYAWHGRWVWAPGGWVVRPHPHAVWVAGRWHHRGHSYVWIGGHWR